MTAVDDTGLGPYADDLAAFRAEHRAHRARERQECPDRRAADLGCSVALVEHIERLEPRLAALEDCRDDW